MFPGEKEPRIIREEDILTLEALKIKYRYIREAGEDFYGNKTFPIGKLISEAKEAYKSGAKERSLTLYQKAIKERVPDITRVKEGQSETWTTHGLSGWWQLYRELAIYYMAEEKYITALEAILKSAILDVASYGKGQKNIFEQIIPPVTLEIIREGVNLGKINKSEFQKIFRAAFEVADGHIKDAQEREPDDVKEIIGIQSVNRERLEKELLSFFYST